MITSTLPTSRPGRSRVGVLAAAIVGALASSVVVAAPAMTTYAPAVAAPGPLQCDATPGPSYALPGGVAEVLEVVNVGETWGGHFVSQSLLTEGTDQYVAYYDADRQMTVAHRELPGGAWTHQALPTSVGWDSHNSVTMAVDRDGHLHVSGNMHGVPLIYFRTEVAGDVTTLERVANMVDPGLESRVTYPKFSRTPDDALLFRFRSGSSGNGDDLYYRYDEASRSWSTFLTTPLLDGEGLRNAYADDRGPLLGPDGNYHMVWVWRDTGAAESSNTPSYARSADLINWENSRGEPIDLPITYATGDVVEAVGPGNGIINNNIRVGFDADGNALVTYHRYDEEGNSQIYLARPGDDGWHVSQITDWEGRWSFSGNGTIVFDVNVLAAEALDNGDIRVDVTCRGDARSIIVDPDSLEQITEIATPALPFAVTDVQSSFPGMAVNLTHDLGGATGDETRVLRWESLPSNRDQPRPAPWPAAGQLSVITLVPSDAPVVVDAVPDNAVHDAGSVVDVTAQVRNVSDAAVSGRLTVTVPSSWGAPMPSAPVQIAPGEVVSITVPVTVPAVTRQHDARLELTFDAGTEQAVARATLTVSPQTPPREFLDHVDLGDAASEAAHGLTASATSGTNTEAGLTRRYTRATANNYFEFTVATPGTGPFTLHIRETYGANLFREYHVSVNGTRIYTNDVAWTGGVGTPSYLLVVDDPALTSGETATVRFQMNAAGRNSDASVADVWVIDASQGDTQAPQIRAEVSSDAEWSATPVELTLFAQDDSPGVVRLEYRVNSGEFETYTTPLLFDADGVHDVEYRAIDAAGNASATSSVTIRVDSTAPEIDVALDGNRMVNARAEDPEASTGGSSGVARLEYRVDDGAWSAFTDAIAVGAEAHLVQVRATDAAGNATLIDVPVAAVADILSEENVLASPRGAVAVEGAVRPGGSVRVGLPGAVDGLIVRGVLYSAPLDLGTAVVTGGELSLLIPASTPLGLHHLALYDAFGELIGWGEVTVIPAAGSTEIASTGIDAGPVALAGVLMLMLGGLFAAARVRRRTS